MRDTLHLVAVHIVARSRQQATGRFSLRVTPGGFGTPEFGAAGRRVRVSGGHLVVESDEEGRASAVVQSIGGATLRELAVVCGVDLDAPLDVGRDTPPVGDVDEPLALDDGAAAQVAECFEVGATVLDRVLAVVTPGRPATLPRLWPEHFDLAIEVDAHPDRRVNLGVSPGDGYRSEPYFYVGPWTDDRPGDSEFWNAPFGAAVTASSVGVDAAVSFLLEGVDRLS